MKRLLSLALFGASLWAAPAATAQPGGGPPNRPGRPDADRSGRDNDRRPDGEVDRLKAQVKELEAKLAAGRDGDRRLGTNAGRDDARRSGPPAGAGRFDSGPGGPRPTARSDRDSRGPGDRADRGPRPPQRDDRDARGDRGGPPRGGSAGRGDGDRGPRPGPGAGNRSDVARQIDRVIRKLTELRREIDRPAAR